MPVMYAHPYWQDKEKGAQTAQGQLFTNRGLRAASNSVTILRMAECRFYSG